MSGTVNRAERVPLLADHAYVAVRDMIVTLTLPPGAPIHEDRLSAELGVGRTPLRDAIKRLEAENLVLIYPRRGTFVSEVNITDHGLISDVRRELEGHAAQRAAERATETERDELQALATALRDDTRKSAPHSMEIDASVHRSIYRCTHNRYLESTLSHYYNLSLRIWYLFLDRLPVVDHHDEHVPLLEAIVAGDGPRARELAAAHVDEFEKSVRAAI